MASEMIEKLPPHNIEAEEAVLGSILVDPGALDDVAAVSSRYGNGKRDSPSPMTRDPLRSENGLFGRWPAPGEP
jgi:hypothetical protein